VKQGLYFAAGWIALVVGFIGMAVPLLPTVAFWILAAWCFTRSSPRLENWLLDHPIAGPHIRQWRERGAISRKGKIAASVALAASSTIGLLALSAPLSLLPLGICLTVAAFIWTRPGWRPR